LPIVHRFKDSSDSPASVTIEMHAYIDHNQLYGSSIPVCDFNRGASASSYRGTPIRFVVASDRNSVAFKVSIVSLSSKALVTDGKRGTSSIKYFDEYKDVKGCIRPLGDAITALVAINHRTYEGRLLLWTMGLQIDETEYEMSLPLISLRSYMLRSGTTYSKRLESVPPSVAREKVIEARDASVPNMLDDVWRFNWDVDWTRAGPCADLFSSITLDTVAAATEEYVALYQCAQFSVYANPYLIKRGCKIDVGVVQLETPTKLSTGAVLTGCILSREIRNTNSAESYQGTLCEIVWHGDRKASTGAAPIRSCRLTYQSSSLYTGSAQKIMGYVRKISPNELMVTLDKHVELNVSISFDGVPASFPYVLRSIRYSDKDKKQQKKILDRQIKSRTRPIDKTTPADPLTLDPVPNNTNQQVFITLNPVVLHTSIAGIILPLFTSFNFEPDDALETPTYQILLEDKTTQESVYTGTAPTNKYSPPFLKWEPTAQSPNPFCVLAFPGIRDISILATSKNNMIFACKIKFNVRSENRAVGVLVVFDLITAAAPL
jgi:hypothetical protein